MILTSPAQASQWQKCSTQPKDTQQVPQIHCCLLCMFCVCTITTVYVQLTSGR
jgi:hypothetical protein